MARPRPIIFDCDGVLVDSEPLAARAYERVYEKHGMPGVNTSIIAQCIGMKQSDIIARIKDLTGHQFPAAADGDIWAETKVLFSQELKPTPGITAFLEALAGDRCVASSSSVERINHSLAVTGLARFFGDAIYSSSMVKN
ncbi:HAD family phosphatase, partial [Mesorhizobium sp. M7A.F.Ca.US.001.04.1.1]